MQFDSDVALLGTGVAPLVAASHLIAQGKSALILNPDHDFFLEDSELPLDPLVPLGEEAFRADRLARSSPESAITELRPFFPGAVEFWSAEGAAASGFHDEAAPHVRSRARLWIEIDETLEELYVTASDRGLKPQILDGLQAMKRFPGVLHPREGTRGLLIPRLCDVDVSRYRNGLLEFVRERLGPERVVCNASQVQLMPGGMRFHALGAPRTARLSEGALVFWTPRLSPWVLSQAKRSEVNPVFPTGVRHWEQWSLVSRDNLDPGVVGMIATRDRGDFDRNLVVWAEIEGAPDLHRRGLQGLAVLRAGPLLGLDSVLSPQGGASWASSESFESLSSLCHDFLQWDRFSVKSMVPRAIFEWQGPGLWNLSRTEDAVWVVSGADGPLVDVVKTARSACERFDRPEAR